MKLDRYELRSGDNFLSYEFISEGVRRRVSKLIQFSLIDKDALFFNLAFGDKKYESGEMDDIAITDNGDSEKVLATVVAAVYTFCDKYPEAWIYATGSTESRTRLYKMGINRYYDAVQTDFEIFGFTKNGWERFEKSKNYQAFVVQRKRLKFGI